MVGIEIGVDLENEKLRKENENAILSCYWILESAIGFLSEAVEADPDPGLWKNLSPESLLRINTTFRQTFLAVIDFLNECKVPQS